MPILTAALSSLPVESIHVLPIGTMEALDASQGGSEKFCSCGGCECFECFGCGGFCGGGGFCG